MATTHTHAEHIIFTWFPNKSGTSTAELYKFVTPTSFIELYRFAHSHLDAPTDL